LTTGVSAQSCARFRPASFAQMTSCGRSDQPHSNMNRFRIAILALVALAAHTGAQAQGTAFTYQGHLTEAQSPATGLYEFEFRIFNSLSAGAQVGSTVLSGPLAVTNGLFTAVIDAGAGVFDGSDRWLGISVRPQGGGSFALLSPRQPLNAAPMAHYAARAAAGGLTGTLPGAALAGTYSSPVSLTNSGNTLGGNGSRLTQLNATNLSGLVQNANLPTNLARVDASQTFSGTNVFLQHLRLGQSLNTTLTNANYGTALVLSGGPDVSSPYTSDNSDPLWLARYNVSDNLTELRIGIGDDPGSQDKLVVGTIPSNGGEFSLAGTWEPKFSVDAAGTVKMGSNAQYYAAGSPQPMRIIAGTVKSDGTISKGTGFTVSKTGTGTYVLIFSESFPNGTITTVTPASTGAREAGWNVQGAASVTIQTTTGGVLTDSWFNFITIGLP
jgi:hypothetical protein